MHDPPTFRLDDARESFFERLEGPPRWLARLVVIAASLLVLSSVFL